MIHPELLRQVAVARMADLRRDAVRYRRARKASFHAPQPVRKSIELRLSVRLITASMTRPGEVKVPDAPLEPLFAMRVPEYGFPSSVVRADPGNPRPRYPGLARMAKADGSVVAEYIVTADGGADIRSLQFLTATALPFVDAVLEVLPQYRYIPLAISGCPVASLVRMPFTFEIIR